MKNEKLTIILFILYLSGFTPGSIYAQDNTYDHVIFLNGDETTGKVTEIGSNDLKFIHKGETLVYTFKKNEINKVQFASGRIEFFTELKVDSAAMQNADQPSLQAHHNSIAVLPFSYIGLGGSRDEKMALKAQSDCYNYFKESAEQLAVQDPVTTNALLFKQNINEKNIAGYLPAELAHILGAEYIVMSMITIDQKGSRTTGGSVNSGKNNGNKYLGYVLGGSTTSNEFSTAVDMKIYDDEGKNIFAKSHQSFWPTENAYMVTLQYLIKRTPLYRK
jgi:hypothetical protein